MQPHDNKGIRIAMRRWRTLTAIALVACVMAITPPARAGEGDDQAGPDAVSSTAQNPCQSISSEAALNNSWQNDPCDLTSTNKTLMDDNGKTFDKTTGKNVKPQVNAYPGGGQVVEYLEGWWRQDALPALRSMTGQLNQSRIDQTRQIGSMIDATSVNNVTIHEQNQELKAARNNEPSELACTTNTQLRTMDKAGAISKAVPKAMKIDMSRRSSGAPGTPGEVGPAGDQKARWDNYCSEFEDPDNNNGVSACPELDDDDPDQAGGIPNGDIGVESLLFQDTIDVGDAHNYTAIWALTQNLVQPHIVQRLPEKAVTTNAGREAILKQQHLDAIRNIALSTVSGIVARRTAIPLEPYDPNSASPPPANNSTDAPPVDANVQTFHATPTSNSSSASTCGSYDGAAYAACFAEHEVSRLNSNAAESKKWPGAYASPTSTLCQRFSGLASRGYAMGSSAYNAWLTLKKKGLVVEGQQPQNAGDIVYWGWSQSNIAAHGGKTYGHTGVYAGGGNAWSVVRSHNPEIIKHPMSRFNNSSKYVYLGYVPLPNDGSQVYQVDNSGSPTSNPPPPKDPAELVHDIRTKAGVDPTAISPTPSYNEIMIAMTKERFMDPEYFIKMQGNVGTIKQEQTSVNAFITAQYQDIYELQEQINALLAARASLKMEMEKKGNSADTAPVR